MNKQTEKKFLKFKLLRGDVDVQTCRNENSSDSLHPKLKFREIDANAIGPEMHSRFPKGVVIHHPLRATTTYPQRHRRLLQTSSSDTREPITQSAHDFREW